MGLTGQGITMGTTHRVEYDTAYWAVVTGSSSFPILGGSHHGVRADLPHDDAYQWGRVFTERADAEAWLAQQLTRQQDAWQDAAAARARGLQTVHQFRLTHRVQAILRPYGASLDIWYPAALEAAAAGRR